MRVVLLIAILLLVGFALPPFPKNDRRREDPADLTGTWAFTSIEMNGVPQVRNNFENYRIVMTKEQIIFHTDRRSEWTLKLDPNASPPSFTWGNGPQINYVGSYQLRGGMLTMIYTVSSRPADRPTSFDKPPYKYTFRRIGRN